MTNILEYILEIDKDLLLFVNGNNSLHLDNIMWWMSDKFIWIILYAFLASAIVYKFGIKKSLICFVVIGLLILVTDQFCASFIRPYFNRIRPSSIHNPLSDLLHLVNNYRGGSYGFPSCHAANSFALAVFLSLLFKSRWIILGLMIWAALISYSRMYLGVHYPTDLLIGAIIGSGLAFPAYYLYSFLIKWEPDFKWAKFLKKEEEI